MTVHRLTIFFTFFVMLQFWNLFNARVFGTNDSAFKGLTKSYGMELIVIAIWVVRFSLCSSVELCSVRNRSIGKRG